MGVNGCSEFMFKSLELTWEQVVEVLYYLARENAREEDKLPAGTVPHTTRDNPEDANESAAGSFHYMPSIDIDANNVAFKDTKNSVGVNMKVARAAREKGVRVSFLADNNFRHCSKRASACRAVGREKTRLKAIDLETRLLAALQQNGCNDESNKLSNELQKVRNLGSRNIPTDFANELNLAVEEAQDEFITCKTAAIQADPLIAKRNINKKCDLVWSNDSDFIVHNPACMLVHSYKITAASGKLHKIILATGQKSAADTVSNALMKFSELRGKQIFKAPRSPIYDLGLDIISRSLLACAMGNDYWTKGQPDFGPAKAMQLAKEAIALDDEDEHSKYILDKISSYVAKTKANRGNEVRCKETILAFSKAFMYEPANEAGAPLEYIHDKPTFLPFYLKEFSCDGCIVQPPTEGPVVKQCVFLGYENDTHGFLEGEGMRRCPLCTQDICMHCCMGKEAPVCMGCYRATFGTTSSSIVDSETMKAALVSACKDIPSKASFLEVRELYETYILEGDGHLCEDEIRKVQMPTMPTSALASDDFVCRVSGKIKDLPKVLRNDDLSNDDVCELMHLCAEFVRYDSRDMPDRKYKVHGILPSIIVDFCRNSRVHGGLRLMNRTARHSVYVDEPNILNAGFKIGRINGELFLLVTKDVAASYHRKSNNKLYNCKMAFTKDNLLATQCNCSAGAQECHPCSISGPTIHLDGAISSSESSDTSLGEAGEDRHACIHTFVPMGCLSLEMYNGLAEQLLIEVNLRINSTAILDNDRLRNDIHALATAAGRKISIANIKVMLDAFAVGTDRSKKSPGSPRPESIRPIRECKFISPLNIIEQVIKKNSDDIQDFSDDDPNVNEDDCEDYSDENGIVNEDEGDSEIVDVIMEETDNEGMSEVANVLMEETDDEDDSVAESLSSMDEEYIKSHLATIALENLIAREYPHLRQKGKRRDPIGRRLLEMRGHASLAKKVSLDCSFDKTHEQQKCERALEQILMGAASRHKANKGAPKHSQPATRTKEETKYKSYKPDIRTARRRCHMLGCNCSGLDGQLTTVPPSPTVPRQSSSKNDEWKHAKRMLTYKMKSYIRRETCDRLGVGRTCEMQHLRYCKSHETEDVHMVVRFKKFKKAFKYRFPQPIGGKSLKVSPSTASKGNAAARGMSRVLKDIDTSSSEMAHQVALEIEDIQRGSYALKDINATILQRTGMDVHLLVEKRDQHIGRKRKLLASDSIRTINDSKKMKVDTSYERDPVFEFKNMKPTEVKRLTGFEDIASLLSFASLVCGGDFNVMTTKVSKMTWLEEWIFYFEYLYSRVHTRWEDYAKQMNVREKTLRNVLHAKLKLVVDAKRRWPTYASLVEDETLRKDHWAKELLKPGQRVRMIMHDMTNIPLTQPSEPELNRALWNSYYNQPCAKGGIFTQLCGWEGTIELFVGSTGDSDYVRLSKLLEEQHLFSIDDLLEDGSEVAFLNVFDKGYRVMLDCYKHGKQLVWQPAFARSDERYGSYATLHTAAVAYTRSGNERSVKHMKISLMMKRGLVGMQRMDLEVLADAWLAWGFQVNFMYDSVH